VAEPARWQDVAVARPALFREAAVAAHAAAAGPGRAVPSSRRLLRRASGPSGVAHLPVGSLSRLAPGQRVSISISGRRVGGRVTTAPEPVEGADGAVAEIHVALDGPAPIAAVRDAPVTVLLGRRSLLSLVRSVFGRRSGRG
jgi:hypothetical protein